jgi:DNA-binding transcriptional MerR regulator
MARSEPIRKSTHGSGAAPSEIPDKLYFRIGEVASLCEIPAYVLRFWESEFPQLKPNKGGTGQRLYRRRDVEMALRIKRLLYDEGYTIPGARQVVKSELNHREPLLPLPGTDAPSPRKLQSLRRELEAIAAMLARPVGKAAAKSAGKPVTMQAVESIRSTRRAAPRTLPQSASVSVPSQIPFDSIAGLDANCE